ncbi:MAG: hypothetical protein KBT28_04840, partial [Bacteroidales bacterium]|nr:hypothetical protein [Candidatus Colimorpha merdihippi]
MEKYIIRIIEGHPRTAYPVQVMEGQSFIKPSAWNTGATKVSKCQSVMCLFHSAGGETISAIIYIY